MSKRIVRFSAKDVLRLSAVEIKPDGNTITLGGANGAGKSSVLNAIALALGGAKAAGKGKAKKIKRPIRDGAERGEVVVDLGDLVVERVFTKSGDRLAVKTKDGAVYAKPQTMLDALFNAVSFDPLAFIDAPDDAQAEQLRTLMGIDLSDLDDEHKQVFAERAEVNHKGRDLKGAVDARPPKHEDAPTEEVSVSALMTELQKREVVKRENETRREVAHETEREWGRLKDKVAEFEGFVKSLEQQLEDARENLNIIRGQCAEAAQIHHKAAAAAVTVDPDLDSVRAQIAGAEEVNRKVRENRERDGQERELERLRESSRALTDKLGAIAAERQKRIAAANFPVDGLGFDTDGVTYQGMPLSQASRAEQIRVSVAVGIAANPDLRVFMIRDGSLLDPDNLKLIHELADKNDCQLWIEDARTTDPTAIVIEDGHVRGAEPT